MFLKISRASSTLLEVLGRTNETANSEKRTTFRAERSRVRAGRSMNIVTMTSSSSLK
ncbi:hypothetical protein YC2023_062013 [Brassica napus]